MLGIDKYVGILLENEVNGYTDNGVLFHFTIINFRTSLSMISKKASIHR
jgi:hypothetical protein